MIVDQFGNPIEASHRTAYRGGDVTRLTRDWQPPHRSGDGAVRESWDLITSRVRDLFRNEPTIKNARRSLCKYVVGTGIQTYAAAMIDRDEYNDEFNDQADDEFERWCDEADIEGRFSWSEIQWQHLNQICEVGESLLLQCSDDDPNRQLPLCYQLLEAEQLDHSQEWPAGSYGDGSQRLRCVRGVEFNSKNQPAAYWLFDCNPYDAWQPTGSTISKRIPASRVTHNYLVERPSQTRGITWFGANIQTTRDLDWYIGNELTAAAIGALLTLIVKRKTGAGGGIGFTAAGDSATTDVNGNREVRLGAGLIADIGADDDVKVAESNRPNRDAAPFLKLIMMLQGMGVGLSYLRYTGDYSQSSYTSARGAHLDDQAFFLVLQDWFGRSCVKKVRREHLRQAIAYNRIDSLSPKQFMRNPRRYLDLDLQPPGREQLDPEKETDAAIKRIDSGLSTHKRECGLRGDHWRRVFRQRAREIKFAATMAKAAGVPMDQFLNLRANPPATPRPAETPPQQSEDTWRF